MAEVRWTPQAADDDGRGMTVAMIALQEFPEGSAIGVTRGNSEIRLHWPHPQKHTPARLLVPLLTVVVAAGGTVLTISAGRSDFVPVVFLPSLLLAVVGVFWYRGWKPRIRTLILRSDSLTFVAPPRGIFPGPGWLLHGRDTDRLDWAEKAEWEAEREALRKRRRITVPRGLDVRVNDFGAARGIAVESAGKSVRIGSSLRDEDREWLANLLRGWAGSATALAEGPPSLTPPPGS